jgi:hypothetical protein
LPRDASLVLGDEIDVGPQRIERGLELGEHRARDLGDHRQPEAPAHVAGHRGLSRRVSSDEVDAHDQQIYAISNVAINHECSVT